MCRSTPICKAVDSKQHQNAAFLKRNKFKASNSYFPCCSVLQQRSLRKKEHIKMFFNAKEQKGSNNSTFMGTIGQFVSIETQAALPVSSQWKNSYGQMSHPSPAFSELMSTRVAHELKDFMLLFPENISIVGKPQSPSHRGGLSGSRDRSNRNVKKR